MALLLAPLRWLTSSIIRLALFAAVLVALYLVLLKPAIDSGEKTVHHSLNSLEKKAGPTRLEHCFKKADGDVGKMERCARIF
jgi:hypothetical protein